MKQIYLTSAVLIYFAGVSFAQIIIESSDLTQIGDNITRYADTIPTYGAGSAGAGQTWDFSGAIIDDTYITDVVSVASTPYATTYSGSDYAMTGATSAYLYFIHNASSFIATGASGDLLETGEMIDAPFSDHAEFYMQLSKKIGYFPFMDEDPITAKLSMDTWMEIRYTEERKKEAYKFSNLSHPLHTDYCDIPWDFIDLEWSCLYCVNPADIGGGTLAVDPEMLIDILQTREPDLYSDLISIPVIFERSEAIFGSNASTIISYDEIGPLFCWNHSRVAVGNTPEAKSLCDRFNDFLVTRILGGGLAVPVHLKKGEALIFQDKRFLHGRSSFYGNRFLKKSPIVKNNIDQAMRLVERLAQSV